MDVMIDGKRFRTNPSKLIGQGGEALIYDIGNNTVLKLYKLPTHPDFVGNKEAVDGAVARIAEHQTKLALFPKGMPKRVVGPKSLALDTKGDVVGYTMPLISQGEVLLRYGERRFREMGGIKEETLRLIYLDLHTTVLGVHKANAVIGDFNDLNVIVVGDEAYLVDTDSMQFGSFYCRVFTAKFLDPTLAKESGGSLILAKKHNQNSDWYAYSIMLMQALLYVGPYGGVFRPQDKNHTLSHDLRPLKRITVFHPEVKYPKPARHFRVLPDDLLHQFENIFTKDVRGVFPRHLVESLVWKTCSTCGMLHMRTLCPACVQMTPPMVQEVSTDTVTARKVFRTTGTILTVAYQGRTLKWVYHESDRYLREDGSLVAHGALDHLLRVKIVGKETLLAKSGRGMLVGAKGAHKHYSFDMFGNLPIVDTNNEALFFVLNGSLVRSLESSLLSGEEIIGSVLANRTLVWVGEELGFGFYKAGSLTRYLIWNIKSRAINDSIILPSVSSQIVDAKAYFGHRNVWFMMTVKEGGEVYNRMYLISDTGQVEARAEGKAGDSSWIGDLRGKCAIGNALFVPTDDGIVRVEARQGTIVPVKEFSSTTKFVDSASMLFPGNPGIVSVRNGEIWNLEMK